MTTYKKSPFSNIEIEDMLRQLTKSDISYFAAIFLTVKALAVGVLTMIWYKNDDRERLIASNQAQAGGHHSDQTGVNV